MVVMVVVSDCGFDNPSAVLHSNAICERWQCSDVLLVAVVQCRVAYSYSWTDLIHYVSMAKRTTAALTSARALT